jgi:putative cofactor-binding repeat protein
MAAPSITIVNDSDITVASWDCGTVQANSDSTILTILVWNNRGGSTALSDLKDVSITTLDIDGGSSSDVVAGKWVQANVPGIDGNNTTWTAIGGTTVKYLRADALAAADGNVIRGIANDGTFTNAKSNYCTCRLKAHVPLNATPGTKVWKTRINGYYV